MPRAILLVDEDSYFVYVVSDYLLHQRHKLASVMVTTGTGADALEKANDPRLRLALVDLHLPHGESTMVISELRNRFPHLGIVAMTLLDDLRTQESALTAGADELCSKLHCYTDLRPALRRALEARQRRMSHLTSSPSEFDPDAGPINTPDDETARAPFLFHTSRFTPHAFQFRPRQSQPVIDSAHSKVLTGLFCLIGTPPACGKDEPRPPQSP